MRTPFDYLGKQIGEAALARYGKTYVNHEIAPEAQFADLRHEPDLGSEAVAARERLGLLGRLASRPCVIELYGDAPSAADLRACMRKGLTFWHSRERDQRAGKLPPGAEVDPDLWIISARTPAALISKLRLEPAPAWPPGVYLFGGEVLRVGLIAANKLPRVASTLLVRLMAGGSLLSHALDDLDALPPDAFEHQVADEILLRLKHMLQSKSDPTPEEVELAMIMEHSWEKTREKGRVEALVKSILTVLRVRGIAVSDAERERILAERDPERLERWHERAVVAPTLADALEA